MFFSFARTTALVLSSTTLTLAFSKISVPSTITADVSAQIKLTKSSSDTDFDLYRVYLATTPPGWGTGPACYLVNSSSTDILDFNVAIPASVGPSGSKYYSISIMQFNSDPNADASSSGFSYSTNFNFAGGKGNWSEYETSGHTVLDADLLPCTAYDCARTCAQANYPADVADTDDITAYKAEWDCTRKCPSVVLPSWEEMMGDTVTANESASSTARTPVSSKTPSSSSATGAGSVVAQTTGATSTSRTSSGTAAGNAASSTAAAGAATTSAPSSASIQMKAGGSLALLAGFVALVL